MRNDRCVGADTRRRAHVAALAALLSAASCGGGSGPGPTPVEALNQRSASQYVDFSYASGDSVDARRQDAYHEWAIGTFGVQMPQRLQYAKYRDRDHMFRLTGQSANGWAEPAVFRVHSIFPWHAHEAAHVYTALIGRPSDFFNEGIAVALAYDPAEGRFVSLWNNTPIHDVSRALQRSGTLPEIATITDTEAFRRVPEQQGYPAAGSFVSFLIDARGMPPMLAFFRGGTREESRGAIETRFAATFGLPVAAAETQWRAFLSGS
jgi:hypothetical protein